MCYASSPTKKKFKYKESINIEQRSTISPFNPESGLKSSHRATNSECMEIEILREENSIKENEIMKYQHKIEDIQHQKQLLIWEKQELLVKLNNNIERDGKENMYLKQDLHNALTMINKLELSKKTLINERDGALTQEKALGREIHDFENNAALFKKEFGIMNHQLANITRDRDNYKLLLGERLPAHEDFNTTKQYLDVGVGEHHINGGISLNMPNSDTHNISQENLIRDKDKYILDLIAKNDLIKRKVYLFIYIYIYINSYFKKRSDIQN